MLPHNPFVWRLGFVQETEKPSLILIKWCINQTNLRDLILERWLSAFEDAALETRKLQLKMESQISFVPLNRRRMRILNKLTRLCFANHLKWINTVFFLFRFVVVLLWLEQDAKEEISRSAVVVVLLFVCNCSERYQRIAQHLFLFL